MKKVIFFYFLFFLNSTRSHAQELTYGGGADDGFYVSPRQQFISEEELDRQNPLTVSDSISRIYSIQTTGHFLGGVTPSIFLRGANSEFTEILWNGLSLNDPTSVGGGADFLNMNREFSSQIRILRGPETLYYGAESLSGLILLERGEFRDRKIKATLAEYSTAQLEFEKRQDFAGSRLLFGGSGITTAGISNVRDLSSHYERDGKSQQSLTAIYENESGESSLQTVANYFNQRVEDDLSRIEDYNAYSKTRDFQGYLQWKTPFHIFGPNLKQQLEFSFLDKKRLNTNPADSINTSTYNSEFGGQKFKVKEAVVLERRFSKTWLGVEFVREQMKSMESYDSFPASEFFEGQNNFNAFVISSTQWPDETQLDLGVRVDQGQSTAWQFRLQKHAVYFLVATGYKTPSLYQRFSSYGNRDLQTQRSLLYEIGEEWALGSQIGTRAAVYKNEYSNLIGFENNRYANINKARSQGAEVELSWKNNLSEARFSVQYNESFQLEPVRILYRRPRWISRADFAQNLSERLQIGVEGEWQSQRSDTDDLGNEQILSSYSLFHGKISYSWSSKSGQQNEKILLRVNNILDATYQQAYAYSTPGRFLSLSYQLSN